MKFQRKLIIIATFLMLAGLAGLVPYTYFWNRNRIALASTPQLMVPVQAPVPSKPAVITGKPSHITISTLSIDLAVIDGVYNPETKGWTLTNDKAQYAMPSVQPNNDAGNTLIYGHAQKQIFGHLTRLTVGTSAVITTDNGYKFTYTYKSTEAVDPTNVDIFAYSGPARLTLQTCSGNWWQNRQFYYFDLISVEKI